LEDISDVENDHQKKSKKLVNEEKKHTGQGPVKGQKEGVVDKPGLRQG